MQQAAHALRPKTRAARSGLERALQRFCARRATCNSRSAGTSLAAHRGTLGGSSQCGLPRSITQKMTCEAVSFCQMLECRTRTSFLVAGSRTVLLFGGVDRCLRLPLLPFCPVHHSLRALVSFLEVPEERSFIVSKVVKLGAQRKILPSRSWAVTMAVPLLARSESANDSDGHAFSSAVRARGN